MSGFRLLSDTGRALKAGSTCATYCRQGAGGCLERGAGPASGVSGYRVEQALDIIAQAKAEQEALIKLWDMLVTADEKNN